MAIRPLIYRALAQGTLLALCLPVQSRAQQQTPQFAKLNIYDDFIQSRGVWLPDNLTAKNEPIPSVADVACYRHGGALLVNSDAYCIVATAQIIFREPNVDVTYYPVLSWSKTRIVAADSPTGEFPICIWSEITINLADKTVSLTDHRKLGKGHEGFNNTCLELPLTENYHLIDEVSERVRRALRDGSKKNKE